MPEQEKTLPDLLVRTLIAKDTDERGLTIQAKGFPIALRVDVAERTAVRDDANRTAKALKPDQAPRIVTVHDARVAVIQQAPQHQELMRLRRFDRKMLPLEAAEIFAEEFIHHLTKIAFSSPRERVKDRTR